jgi:hypothetical protein
MTVMRPPSASKTLPATGFELATPPVPVPYTREAAAAEARLIREVLDPVGLRYREVIS